MGLYLKSGGQGVVDFFKKSYRSSMSKDYPDFIYNMHKYICPSDFISQELKDELIDLTYDLTEGVYIFDQGKYSIDKAMKILFQSFYKENKSDAKLTFDVFTSSIAYFTTMMSVELNEIFIPYYYKHNFNILEKIFTEFDILLPKMPVKSDYKGRFLYYGQISKSLYDFRIKNGLSPYELFAFLYDFAPKYVGGIESYIVDDLPRPKAAYFIAGAKNDIFLENSDDNIIPWQCNPDTIAMYIKYPISSIDSIWRSVSVGFVDPFFYYYRCTYIKKERDINKISLKDMKTDPVFSRLSIVRKNMQGINGVEIIPSAYNYLLDKSKSDAQKLQYYEASDGLNLYREKDVEDRLIKPLLSKLGYEKEDYTQQLYLSLGNNMHTLIPDFVIKPKIKYGHYSADFIIEAKYSIGSKKILEKAKNQARSYAKLLGAKYIMVGSKELISLASFVDDYEKEICSYIWKDLEEDDKFYELYKLIGKEKI